MGGWVGVGVYEGGGGGQRSVGPTESIIPDPGARIHGCVILGLPRSVITQPGRVYLGPTVLGHTTFRPGLATEYSNLDVGLGVLYNPSFESRHFHILHV